MTNHHNDVNEWFCFSSPETKMSLVFFSCHQWSWISPSALILILILILRHSQKFEKHHLPCSYPQMTPLPDFPSIQSQTRLHSHSQMLRHTSRGSFSHLQNLRTFINVYSLKHEIIWNIKWFIGLQDEKKELLLFWVKMFFSRLDNPEVVDIPLLVDPLKPPGG